MHRKSCILISTVIGKSVCGYFCVTEIEVSRVFMVTLVGRSIQQVSRVSLLRAGGGRGACCASQTPPPPTPVPPDQAHPLASTPDPLPRNSLFPEHPTCNNHLAELDLFSILVTAIRYSPAHRTTFIEYLHNDSLVTSNFVYFFEYAVCPIRSHISTI